ncbi:MAG: type II secretion system F family protein [Candidatus Peregrinibacteria bacterium]|nr:type II secretion system F family protein [Candidatus Peregrinibacteria bacterium]
MNNGDRRQFDKNLDNIMFEIYDEEDSFQKVEHKTLGVREVFNLLNEWIINQSPISLIEKLIFFELLGAMVNAGVAIPESLSLIAKQTQNERMKRILIDMKNLIEDGTNLADAMRRNNNIFDEATCSVVEAGEKSGKLNEVLKELIIQYERLNTVQKKIQSVMIYPIIVIVVMILLAIVVMLFVIPKLTDLFDGAENLPLPTRILINMSNFTIHHWPWLIVGFITIPAAFIWWKNSKYGKRIWGAFVLNIPGISGLIKNMILSRITRIFGFLIASGVPIIDGLKIAAHIAENPIYEEKLLLTADDLTKGIPIAENLSDDEKMFPPMLVNMIAIGEKTASLETIMGKIAGFYDETLDRKVGNLSKIMEPFILAIIASGAVFMILAIFLPILKMNEQIMG